MRKVCGNVIDDLQISTVAGARIRRSALSIDLRELWLILVKKGAGACPNTKANIYCLLAREEDRPFSKQAKKEKSQGGLEQSARARKQTNGISFVTLSESFRLSGPQFLYLQEDFLQDPATSVNL